MQVAVYNTEGKETKKMDLNDAVFGVEPNDHAIYLDAKQNQANKRQGTHKAKERGEITGSTRKLRKQKGSGAARVGSIKSPIFRGGGRIFGPRPRNYEFKLNKKVKDLARKSALSTKIKADELIVVEDFNMDAPKTQGYQTILSNLKVEGKSLLVVNEYNKNVLLSSRNLPKAKVMTASDITTYDILNAGKVILAESSVATIENILK